MTEYPCKIPSDFLSKQKCHVNCRIYEPPWATRIRGSEDGYCAAFYDPENKVDCRDCGTIKLYSGPIEYTKSDDKTSDKKEDWKDRIHKVLKSIPSSVSTEIIEFINNISN